jgi:hypothetical protein
MQSSQPALQEPVYVQVPPAPHATPLAWTTFVVQLLPQDPQFDVVSSGVSQPSALPPVQSPKPLLQEPV